MIAVLTVFSIHWEGETLDTMSLQKLKCLCHALNAGIPRTCAAKFKINY